jgi:hypothetical protein
MRPCAGAALTGVILSFASAARACVVCAGELAIAPTRAIVRTLGYNHPSTAYVFVAIIVSGKKATGRFVIATISSEVWITIASLTLAVFEVCAVMSVARRDRFVYKCMCSGRDADPLATMKHAKNKKLRIQLAHLETTLEIVFIILCQVFIGYVGTASMSSPENGVVMTVDALFVSFAIQYTTELVVDFINVLYLTCIANQPYLEYSQLHHEHQWLTMSIVVFFASVYVVATSLPLVLYRIAPQAANSTCTSTFCGHDASWVWNSPCVLDSNSTYNACI